MLTAALCTVLLFPQATEGGKPKLAVMPTAIDPSAKNRVPNVVDDYVLTAVHNLGQFDVIGQDDINSLLSFDKQKQSLGCDDASCFAELGGALGVEKLLVVKIASLGESWALTAKLIQIAGAPRVLARETKITNDVSATTLLGSLDALVRAVFGFKGDDGGEVSRPPPPEPKPEPARVAERRVEPAADRGAEPPPPPAPGRPRFGVEARFSYNKFSMTDSTLDTTGVTYDETDSAFGALACVRLVGGLWVAAGLQYEKKSVDLDVLGASATGEDKHLDALLDLRWVFGQMRFAPYGAIEIQRSLWDDNDVTVLGVRFKGGMQVRIVDPVTIDAGLFAGSLDYEDSIGDTISGVAYGLSLSVLARFGG